jgi:hypothetical protein
MATTLHIKARITPWDDPLFVQAYERAVADMERSGDAGEGPNAARLVETRLREAGFPDARIDVVRTVTEALERTSHWDVRRDG